MRGRKAPVGVASLPACVMCMRLKNAQAAAYLSFNRLRAQSLIYTSYMEARKGSTASAASSSRTWSPQHGIRFNTTVSSPTTGDVDTEYKIEHSPVIEAPRDTARSRSLPQRKVQRNVHTVKGSGQDEEDVTKKLKALKLTACANQEQEEQEKARFKTPHFVIPEEALREAREAIEKEEERFWTFDMYRGPEGKSPQLWYCHSKWQTERVCRDHFLHEKVLGFDIEWVNDRWGPRKISVIQLASASHIGIFHLARHGGRTAFELVAPTLKTIIESSSIIKTGVNIAADRTHLAKFLRMQGTSIIDLGQLYNLVHRITSPPGTRRVLKRTRALQKLTTEFLQLPMRKDMAIRTGDWTRRMEREELVYCADDAYAGFHLFHVLNAKRISKAPILPLPPSAELGLDFFLPEDTEPESSEEESSSEEVIELDDDDDGAIEASIEEDESVESDRSYEHRS